MSATKFHSQQKYVPEIFPGRKSGRYVDLSLPPSFVDCHEICESQPSGTLRVCSDLSRPRFTFLFTRVNDAVSCQAYAASVIVNEDVHGALVE